MFVFYQCLLYCFLTCPQECFGVFWGREIWAVHLDCVSLSSWHLCPIPQQQTIKEKYLLICPYGLWQLMNLPKMLNYPFTGLTTQLLVTRRWHFLETEWSTFCISFSRSLFCFYFHSLHFYTNNCTFYSLHWKNMIGTFVFKR